MAFIENIKNNIAYGMRQVKKWLFPNNAYLGTYDDFSVIRDKSAAVINPNVALTYSTIFACVRVIAETIATLPLFLYKVKGNNKVKAREHNLYSLLHDSPNQECTSVSFFESLITQILLTGNGFAEIIRDNFNNILELNLLDSNKIRVYRDNFNNIVY